MGTFSVEDTYQARGWQESVEDRKLVTSGYSGVSFRGTCFRNVSKDQSISLSFTFTSSFFRRSRLGLPISVSHAAEVVMLVGKRSFPMQSLSASTSDIQMMHSLEWDVTEASEGARESHGSLLIRYGDEQPHETTIYVQGDAENTTAKIVENWDRRYSSAVLVYLALSWLLVQSTLMIGLAHIRQNSALFQIWTLMTGGGVLVALAGLDAFAKLPVHRFLRRQYDRVRRFRVALLISLAVCSILLLNWQLFIINCVMARHHYTEKVQSAMQGSVDDRLQVLTDAFMAQPWRIEGQALLSEYVWSQRGDNRRENSRKAIQYIDERVGEPVFSGRENGSGCQKVTDNEVLRDPTLWYANLLPGAESLTTVAKKYERKCETILRKGNHPLYLLTLLSSQAAQVQETDLSSYASIMSVMKVFLQNDDNRRKCEKSHFYQEALDQMAYHALVQHLAVEAKDKQRFEDTLRTAVYRYRELIDVRSHQLALDPFWLRTPQKLSIYQFLFATDTFTAISDEDLKAKEIMARRKKFVDTLRKMVFKVNYRFLNSEEWKKGTVLDKDERKRLNGTLTKGWRY